MPAPLATLIFERSTELQKRAREENLKGYSNLDRAGLIAELSAEPLSKVSRRILSENKPDLKVRAREAGLKGFSKMKRDQLALELIRAEESSGAARGRTYVKVYVAGDCAGYCLPKKHPGVSTYLRGHDSLEEARAAAREAGIGFKIDAFESVISELPPGAAAKEPPR